MFTQASTPSLKKTLMYNTHRFGFQTDGELFQVASRSDAQHFTASTQYSVA